MIQRKNLYLTMLFRSHMNFIGPRNETSEESFGFSYINRLIFYKEKSRIAQGQELEQITQARRKLSLLRSEEIIFQPNPHILAFKDFKDLESLSD